MTADATMRGAPIRLSQILREGLVIAAAGLPLAYGVTLIWGVPVIMILRRFGAIRASSVVAAGALGGAALSIWLGVYLQGDLFRLRLPIPLGATLGALAGGAFLFAARGNKRPGVEIS